MPEIVAYHHLSFSVTDLARSTAWYGEALGLAVVAEFDGPSFRRARLRPRGGGVTLTLTQHEAGSGDRFDERRTGLDHAALQLTSRAEVEALERRFTELGIQHSEVRPPGGDSGSSASMFFRDPDNIQLEAFALGPPG